MKLQDRLLAATDQCVLCGICLPHCPTFQLRGQEVESPRGRIALLQALASGALEPTPALREHIDNCLVCRSCEKRCPSGVRYTEIISDGRALLRELQATPRAPDLASRLETRLLAGDGALGGLTRLAARTGLAPLAVRSGLLGQGRLAHLGRLLPQDSSGALPRRLAAKDEMQGRVALFLGCTGRLFERRALLAAAELLSHCGYAVELPRAPHCCGSRALAHGDLAQAEQQRSETLALFDGLLTEGVTAVLTLNSACGGLLGQFERWAPGEASTRLVPKVHDLVTFLLQEPRFATLPFNPSPLRVALHTPCSATNLLGPGHDPKALLRRIPGLELVSMPQRYGCCGAAGDYLLDHPQTADTLREPLLAALAEAPCAALATSNIGCALHLAEGLRAVGMRTEVLHPLVLLAGALAEGPSTTTTHVG